MESTETKKTVKKEVIKINMYGEQIKEALEQEEIGKLSRLCTVTVPNKLTLLDELIEKTSELMIDEEELIGVVQEWIKGTRTEFQGVIVLYEKGKLLVDRHNAKVDELVREKVLNQERKNREDERREMWEYEEQLRHEKMRAERTVWREQQQIMIETKEKEIEMERRARETAVNLPKLSIAPFKGTPTDWIRFSNQFMAQVDCQPVNKVVKLGYLLQSVRGGCQELIGNIPNNEEGYDKALQLLKDEYGQERTVITAHTKEIIDLLAVKGVRYAKIRQFYDTLCINYEALRAMKDHTKVEGLVLPTLAKLPGIKADLTRNDDNWENWSFDDLLTEIRKWLKRNENDDDLEKCREEKRPEYSKHKGAFMTTERRGPRCFYCPKKPWPDQCDTVLYKKERKGILRRKGACFKCGGNHLMKNCMKRGCYICQGNHHSSLHEEKDQKPEENQLYTPSNDCIMPLIPVEVKGQQIWGILDTGATKNYISRKAVEFLKLKPLRWEVNSLRTAAGPTTAKKRAVYELRTYTVKGEEYRFEVVCLDQGNFSKVSRTPSEELKLKYDHLRGLSNSEGKDGNYEVHILIGDPTFTEVRTGHCRKGKQGQPIADETLFGWAVHGERVNDDQSYFTQTTNEDYELLYRLDVLGVEDRREFDQEEIMKEFVENIQHQTDGRYKVRAPWIEERVPQSSNEAQSRARLKNLLSKMKEDVRERYDAIVKEQLELGNIEEAPEKPEGKRLFYMPHRPAIREGAVSTKIRVVFDASAKPPPEEYSINECMNPGPPTQPHLWDILIRSRMAPVCIVGDVEKAFLQIESTFSRIPAAQPRAATILEADWLDTIRKESLDKQDTRQQSVL